MMLYELALSMVMIFAQNYVWFTLEHEKDYYFLFKITYIASIQVCVQHHATTIFLKTTRLRALLCELSHILKSVHCQVNFLFSTCHPIPTQCIQSFKFSTLPKRR